MKKDQTGQQLNVRITRPMKEQLEELAAYYTLSQTDIIRQAIRREYRAMMREKETEKPPLKLGGKE